MGLFKTAEDRPDWRTRRRDWLTGTLTSVACRVCAAGAGTGCDRDHPGTEALVLLSRDPVLLAHATRLADALAAHPHARKLALAQFAPGTIPAGLAAPAPAPDPAPSQDPPGPASTSRRRDPAGYRSSASRQPRWHSRREPS